MAKQDLRNFFLFKLSNKWQ